MRFVSGHASAACGAVGRLTLYSAMAKHAEAGDIRLVINPVTLIVAVPSSPPSD
ncbi:MAG: hypothetical protein ABSG40_01290 [Terriglobales bacterium]